ncbi:unnamed protein product, partial [marine sediment metagenome]
WTQAMIEQAQLISSWAPNIVIKIPATSDGLEVTSALAKENIKVNFTLCFSLNQALLGALYPSNTEAARDYNALG